MSSAPGFSHFPAFTAGFDKMNPDGKQNITCFEVHVIPAGESDNEDDSSSSSQDDELTFQDPDLVTKPTGRNPKLSTEPLMSKQPVLQEEYRMMRTMAFQAFRVLHR